MEEKRKAQKDRLSDEAEMMAMAEMLDELEMVEMVADMKLLDKKPKHAQPIPGKGPAK